MNFKKIIFPVVGLCLIGGSAYYGYYWYTEGRYHETTDNAYLQSDQVAISSKVSGYVSTLLADENRRVHIGDVLLKIDSDTYKAELDRANAVLEGSKAALVTMDEQVSLQRAAIDQAVAQKEIAEVEVTRAKEDYARYKDLMKKGAASRQRFDYAAADQEKANAQLTAAKATLAVEKGRLSVLKAQRLEADSAVKQAAANRDLAEQALEDTEVRAPFDGVIGNRSVQMGAFVQPGQQLLVLVPLPDIYVVANFKETQISHIAPGQRANIEIDAFPDHKFEAMVDSFSPATGAEFSLLPPENATGNFTKITQRVPVRLKILDSDLVKALRPGLSVVVDVDVRGTDGSTQTAGAGLSQLVAQKN
ncbi:MAG: HlyD family secretion protein [Alphaproteobacteria bacterium]|nr:MAG: HlyD family secretion protein [Alphaproteobacteria bacterium]